MLLFLPLLTSLLPLPASPPSRLVANNRAAVRMQGTLLGGGSMDDLSAQELAAFAGASKDPLQQPRPEYDLGVPTGRPDEVVWGARAPESAGEMAAWAARLQEKGIAIRVASPKLVMEESPESYKDVTQVVETCHEAGLSNKAVRLRPIAVIKG